MYPSNLPPPTNPDYNTSQHHSSPSNLSSIDEVVMIKRPVVRVVQFGEIIDTIRFDIYDSLYNNSNSVSVLRDFAGDRALAVIKVSSHTGGICSLGVKSHSYELIDKVTGRVFQRLTRQGKSDFQVASFLNENTAYGVTKHRSGRCCCCCCCSSTSVKTKYPITLPGGSSLNSQTEVSIRNCDCAALCPLLSACGIVKCCSTICCCECCCPPQKHLNIKFSADFLDSNLGRQTILLSSPTLLTIPQEEPVSFVSSFNRRPTDTSSRDSFSFHPSSQHKLDNNSNSFAAQVELACHSNSTSPHPPPNTQSSFQVDQHCIMPSNASPLIPITTQTNTFQILANQDKNGEKKKNSLVRHKMSSSAIRVSSIASILLGLHTYKVKLPVDPQSASLQVHPLDSQMLNDTAPQIEIRDEYLQARVSFLLEIAVLDVEEMSLIGAGCGLPQWLREKLLEANLE